MSGFLCLLLSVELQGLLKPCPARLVFGRGTEEASDTLQSSQECYTLGSLKSPIINTGYFQHFFLM